MSEGHRIVFVALRMLSVGFGVANMSSAIGAADMSRAFGAVDMSNVIAVANNLMLVVAPTNNSLAHHVFPSNCFLLNVHVFLS